MRIQRWSLVVVAGLAIVTVGVVAIGGAQLPMRWLTHARPGGLSADVPGEPPWRVVDRYCVACHNEIDLAGGFSFEKLDRRDFHRNAEVWEAAVRKLRTGLMPPMGEPRPERAALDGMARWLEHELDAAWEKAPNPGAKPLARLNRAEYANAIRDLLAYDGRAIASALPPDASIGGFDNIADALSVSPTLLEGYAAAAMQIGRRAVGDRSMGHLEARYAAAGGTAQQRHIEGLPLGTRGGLAVEHTFPLDAEYEFVVSAAVPIAGWENPTGQMIWCNGPTLDVTFNGAQLEVDDPRRFRLRVPAGPQRITVALVDEQRCAGVNELYAGEVTLGGAVQALAINGPFNATGVGDTPSRREIFVCHPESAAQETPCAERILARLATRAYRRPAEAQGDEIAELMQFYRMGREEGGDFEVGIQYALSRMLVDPRFLYRFEREPPELSVGDVYRVDDLELASRLSFFLWSSIPDEELLALAAAAQLSDPAVLAAQVERMLADERSQSLVENFASQWLLLRELDEVVPQDPDFDADLRAAFRRETELLFTDVLRERRSVLDLLDADYTYLNERLAAHYGIAGVRDSYMRKVTLPADSPRRGLLGHGSILTATSAPNRTSPVVRGQWIVQNILGAPVPSPPPGAEADLSAEARESEKLVGDTVRERLEMHRANSTCASCHGIMDPLGLALENFDLLGRWREHEDGHAINSAAEMVDGTKLQGPGDLRRALLGRADAFVTTVTERLMTYALGRELAHYDQPVVRHVVRAAGAQGHTLVALVQAIVASDSFQKRVKTGAAPVVADAASTFLRYASGGQARFE
jgi:mono/diheme cytochrome c family protein